jgi:hypothetical protein
MAVPDLQDAITHLQQKDLDAAIAALERKVEELPAHLTAHVLLARALEAKHEWQEALSCWENVRFLMPNSPVGRAGKARVLRRLNRPEEADEVSATADAGASDEAAAPDEAAPNVDAPDEDASDEDAPAAPPPAEDDATAATEEEPDDAPTTATEAVSELEQLRRQAEEEARRGGARPGLAGAADEAPAGDAAAPSSPDTPEERVETLEDDEDDLDRLIDELESARIEPDPDVEAVPEPDLENDVDDLVSETLARIHEAQDQYRKAAQIYLKLASQEPDQARTYLQKASEMREQAEAKENAEQ